MTFSGIDFYAVKQKKTIQVAFFAAGFFLLFIGAFRYENNADWHPYEVIFNNIANTGDIFLGIEFGFGALCLFFGTYGNFRLMIFFMAIFSIGYKLKFLKDESKCPFLSLLIYFTSIYIGSDFVNIRQGMALGFSLIAFNYAFKNKFLPFLITAACAFSLHYSAIIIFPFYFLIKIKLTKIKIIVLLLTSFIVSFSIYPLIGILANALSIAYLKEKFLLYSFSGVGTIEIILQVFAISIVKIPVIIFYCQNKKILLTNKKDQMFFDLYVWGYVAVLACSQASATLVRFATYFEIYELILIPNITAIIKKRERFIFCILFVLYMIIALYRNCLGVAADYPYRINFNIFK